VARLESAIEQAGNARVIFVARPAGEVDGLVQIIRRWHRAVDCYRNKDLVLAAVMRLVVHIVGLRRRFAPGDQHAFRRLELAIEQPIPVRLARHDLRIPKHTPAPSGNDVNERLDVAAVFALVADEDGFVTVGRRKLSTKPSFTGSAPIRKTIGIVVVAARAARGETTAVPVANLVWLAGDGESGDVVA